jgi:hypothetical protein
MDLVDAMVEGPLARKYQGDTKDGWCTAQE